MQKHNLKHLPTTFKLQTTTNYSLHSLMLICIKSTWPHTRIFSRSAGKKSLGEQPHQSTMALYWHLQPRLRFQLVKCKLLLIIWVQNLLFCNTVWKKDWKWKTDWRFFFKSKKDNFERIPRSDCVLWTNAFTPIFVFHLENAHKSGQSLNAHAFCIFPHSVSQELRICCWTCQSEKLELSECILSP